MIFSCNHVQYICTYFFGCVPSIFTAGHTSPDLCSNKDRVLNFDVPSGGERKLVSKTKLDAVSHKILGYKKQLAYIDSIYDFIR